MHLWWLYQHVGLQSPPNGVTLNFSPRAAAEASCSFPGSPRWHSNNTSEVAKRSVFLRRKLKLLSHCAFLLFFSRQDAAGAHVCRGLRGGWGGREGTRVEETQNLMLFCWFYGPIADRVDLRPTHHKFSGSVPEHPLAAGALQCQWNLSVVQTCWCFCLFLHVIRADWDIFTRWGQYNVVLVYISSKKKLPLASVWVIFFFSF